LSGPIIKHVSTPGPIYMHTLLVWGLLNRTYELTDSAIWAIEKKRPQTATHMLRALIETLGFTYYIMEELQKATHPSNLHEKITAFFMGSRHPEAKFKSVNILTCIDKATKLFPHLREVYDQLSEVVHPNSASLAYSGMADPEKGESHAKFGLPFYVFKGDDEKIVINQVGECCHHIASLCDSLMQTLTPPKRN
jgi:hypothetical protein